MKMVRNVVGVNILSFFVGAFLSFAWAEEVSKLSASQLKLEEAQCNVETFGRDISKTLIGEPVSAVTLSTPVWKEEANGVPSHCYVSGAIDAIDPAGQPINFAVVFPATWNGRAIQKGGGGMNGVIPNLTGKTGVMFGGGSDLNDGYVSYGSDSGHGRDPAWLTNDEAIKNLGYMQMKKTHDAAMVLIEKAYGAKPQFNYYIGHSQGGREALTVAQRYPADYDGIVAGVPIVHLSSLMLAPTKTRIQEKALKNWVPASKGKAIAAEFIRQCDGLDGLMDGVINNYVACRAIFNVGNVNLKKSPWLKKHCPDNIDPHPADDSINACFTEEQIQTLHFVFSRSDIGTKVVNGKTQFGMWAPTTTVGRPGGFGGLFVGQRFSGQEGAAEDARAFMTLGVEGVTGIIMGNVNSNPLDYGDGKKYRQRLKEISQWVDSTDPDLSAFKKRGGKMLVTIGTDDNIASTGAQLDYYQAVIAKMGQQGVDDFARLWVIPQADHGLRAMSYTLNGNLEEIGAAAVPHSIDSLKLITEWVENDKAPARHEVLHGQTGSRPLCSYPEYPAYQKGEVNTASSYRCSQP